MAEAVALGIDLSWSDKNRSGCVALDSSGEVVDARLLTTDDELLEWVAEMAAPDASVAVDAPLLVPNETGGRPCESEVGRAYGARKASPYSSSRSHLLKNHGRIRGEDLVDRLNRLGFGDPWSHQDRTVLEVYPHPALVEAFSLDERLLYKKGKVDVRRQGLRNLMALVGCLVNADPPLRGLTIEIDDAVRGQRLKDIEDLLDAHVCAWLAALWQHHGRSRMRLFGDADSGHIAVPSGPAVPLDVLPDLISVEVATPN